VTPYVESAPPSAGSAQPNSEPVLVSEQQVVLSTAAALSSAPATIRRRWWRPTSSPTLRARSSAAIRRIVTPLPEPRRYYPRREPNYYESARMSRQMGRL